MKKESIIEAIKTGHKTSSILSEVLDELSGYYCPNSYGPSDGSFSSDPCEECIICISKQIIKE